MTSAMTDEGLRGTFHSLDSVLDLLHIWWVTLRTEPSEPAEPAPHSRLLQEHSKSNREGGASNKLTGGIRCWWNFISAERWNSHRKGLVHWRIRSRSLLPELRQLWGGGASLGRLVKVVHCSFNGSHLFDELSGVEEFAAAVNDLLPLFGLKTEAQSLSPNTELTRIRNWTYDPLLVSLPSNIKCFWLRVWPSDLHGGSLRRRQPFCSAHFLQQNKQTSASHTNRVPASLYFLYLDSNNKNDFFNRGGKKRITGT